MAYNAHIINNPMDVIQADETADIAIANGYITPVDISERDKYPTIKVETIMRPLNGEEGVR